MRGLSGAVTALILVVASVIIALLVVGFAFNLFSTFGGAGAVTPVGPAYLSVYSLPPNVNGITYNPNYVYLEVTLDNRGPPVNVTCIIVNGETINFEQNPNLGQEWVIGYYNNFYVTPVTGFYILVGQHTFVFGLALPYPNPIKGSPVSVEIELANGQTVYVAATVSG